MTRHLIFAGLTAVLLPTSAHAHAGHIGELAGHAHWVGAAALAGAALIAGVIALKDRKKKQDETGPEAEAEDADTAGEAAQ